MRYDHALSGGSRRPILSGNVRSVPTRDMESMHANSLALIETVLWSNAMLFHATAHGTRRNSKRATRMLYRAQRRHGASLQCSPPMAL